MFEELRKSFHLNPAPGIKSPASNEKENKDEKDKSWSAELKIPLNELPGIKETPKEGESWEANLYRIDKSTKRKSLAYRTWTGVGNDFHKLRGAGVLTFGKSLSIRGEKKPAEKKEGQP